MSKIKAGIFYETSALFLGYSETEILWASRRYLENQGVTVVEAESSLSPKGFSEENGVRHN